MSDLCNLQKYRTRQQALTVVATITALCALYLLYDTFLKPEYEVPGGIQLRVRSEPDEEVISSFKKTLGDKVVVNQNIISDYWYRRGHIPEPSPLSSVGQYPVYKSLLEVIEAWNPDDPEIPPNFQETLQHFNYSNPVERAWGLEYRDAELPFKFYDVPEFAEASALWTDEYLVKNFAAGGNFGVDRSKNNHFMWSSGGRGPKGYTPPTEKVSMSFNTWRELARAADENKITAETPHFYFQTGSQAHDRKTKANFVARDLPLFSSLKPTDFVTNPSLNKGIQCRFSMRGIIAESHYDTGKNMIAMLLGQKRYVLNPPEACKQLGIIKEQTHPSRRHSSIDWSSVKEAKENHFDKVDAIDTIVKAGEVLYVPSWWFHYIISLEYSAQCNSRSGPAVNGQSYIDECMK